jgi:parallel beta-helix repeat protein
MNTYNKVVFMLLAAIALCGMASAETLYVNETGWWADPTWQSDSDIISGLGDVGAYSKSTVFQKDSTWYLIAGNSDGTFNGYNWTGSAWQQDSIINNSLGDIGVYSTPTVFQKDSTWYLITGEFDGTFIGYNWTGSAWQQDSAINNSLGDVGEYSKSTVFQKDSTWYLIAGNADGTFNGYNWTGSAWQQDSTINNSLGDIGSSSAPTVFQKDSTWYLIAGEQWGQFEGFNLLSFNATATPIQHAIDNATSGDTVYVWNGSYTENIDISTAHLTIEGEGRTVVNITAANSGDHVFNVTANHINITGVNVASATGASMSGVYVYSANNCNISYSTFSNNYWGIALYYHCYNNTVTDNNASGNGDGIYITVSDDNIITNNIANSNTGSGIFTRGINNTLTNNTANSNYWYGIFKYFADSDILTNNTANSNEIGIYSESSDGGAFTSNTANSNTKYGVYLSNSEDNILTTHNSTNNTIYDYFAWQTSVNNTLLNCNLSSATSMMNDSTSQLIIKYTDGRIIDTDDPALSTTCYAGNCTLTLQPTELNYTVNMTTLDVIVSTTTGSVSVSANSSLIGIDYVNSTINDLNITALDRQLILESAGVQTMVFNPTNIFNLWDFEYYINATANRKAVAFNTYCTNATNLINFTFYDLYPSSNFDCKYNSTSFTTNTSGTAGTLEFNKSTWDVGVTRTVEIYMTTTPYSCGGGVCFVDEGNSIMLYLDLNDTSITHVRAEITKPNGNKANSSMTDFLDDGAISWYINYADTGAIGTYTVNNFYSSKDGSTWKQLDSFLTFTSKVVSGIGGGGGGAIPDDKDDEEDARPNGGAGVDTTPPPAPEPEPEEHEIKPAAQFSSLLVGGFARFNNSYVVSVETNQSGTVQIDEFILNPTTTSLIGGTRYGYVDIVVPNPNIGGTICFATPPDLSGTLGIYQLDNNEWMELETTQIGSAWCVDVAHFSYFAIADPNMESVVESLTALSFSPPKVDGILLYGWSDAYTTTHTADRELANVSASEGIICRILETGDYPHRTLECTYIPETDGDWHSQKYTGEVIAIDSEGYTKRIPVSILIYDMGKLAFPLFVGVVLIGGVILYRRYD